MLVDAMEPVKGSEGAAYRLVGIIVTKHPSNRRNVAGMLIKVMWPTGELCTNSGSCAYVFVAYLIFRWTLAGLSSRPLRKLFSVTVCSYI